MFLCLAGGPFKDLIGVCGGTFLKKARSLRLIRCRFLHGSGADSSCIGCIGACATRFGNALSQHVAATKPCPQPRKVSDFPKYPSKGPRANLLYWRKRPRPQSASAKAQEEPHALPSNRQAPREAQEASRSAQAALQRDERDRGSWLRSWASHCLSSSIISLRSMRPRIVMAVNSMPISPV